MSTSSLPRKILKNLGVWEKKIMLCDKDRKRSVGSCFTTVMKIGKVCFISNLLYIFVVFMSTAVCKQLPSL